MASFDPAFYDASQRGGDRPRRGFVVSGDRFNGITLPGDAPTEEAIADFPVLASMQRLYHGVPNGFSETPKDGFQPRLGMAYAIDDTHHVPRRHRPVPQPRADQHHGGLRLQPAAVGDADGDQRRGGPAGRRRDAQLPAGDGDAVARLHQPDVVGVERHRGPRAAVADARHAVLRGPVRLAPRARAQHQPDAHRHHAGESRASTPTRCARIWASAASRCTRPRARRATTACRRRSSAARCAASASAWPIPSRATRTTPAAAATSCPTPTTTATSTASRIWIGRTCWCRRCATASRRSMSKVAPMRWVLGNWDISGIFQAQSGAPFTVRAANDYAGVGPAAAAVLGADRRSVRGPHRVGSTHATRPSGSTATPSASRPPARSPPTQERNSLRQPGFWDVNLSLRKAFNIVRDRPASGLPARGVQRLQPHAPRQRRDQPDPAGLRLDRGAHGQPRHAGRDAVSVLGVRSW